MLQEIKLNQIQHNVFQEIGKRWMLITAGNEQVNTMTASWGGLGVLWNRNVAFIFVRPQRYTKTFIDENDTFSLCFFDESKRNTLTYLGSVSGKDEDKISKSNLHLDIINDTPYFKEATDVYICKKLYHQPMTEACFIDESCDNEHYPSHDYHEVYVGEILHVYQNK